MPHRDKSESLIVNEKKVIIGIIGLLLQPKMYEKLFKTLQHLDSSKYEVHIYGKGFAQKEIETYCFEQSNIKYFGEYNLFKDAAKIYNSLDVLYMAYDTKNGSLNNQIALPNKLYEAMYFSIPVITNDDSYLGERAREYGIGFTINCHDLRQLKEVLLSFYKNKKQFKHSFKDLQLHQYLADDDYNNLECYLFNLSR